MYASMHENGALDAARSIARSRGRGDTVSTAILEEQVCAEAGLWEPAAARRALDQSHGDPAHAVSILRVWAAAQPHLDALTVQPEDMVLTRRLSSAYPQIPGGQWLGFAPDLIARQLDWSPETRPDDVPTSQPRPAAGTGDVPDAPRRADTMRVRDLIENTPTVTPRDDGPGDDPARAVLVPPHSRPNRLALLARGETGALVSLSAMILGRRQEAVLVELTAGAAWVRIPHPRTGIPVTVAQVPITEVEVVLDADVDGRPGLALGWGATLGTVERRAIALALLDAAMLADGDLAEPLTLDEQTVIAATDGPATTGFVEHLRLPHYAGFTAYLAQAADKERK
ncbi:carbon-phosphorus lyase complex subunit PhnI [Mycobacterium sp. NAZ190054]|uniref:carbon-phosphorus lyase complex subunit PhnI n=1 Tax=Mycobacterium sp. NAZ190054 TaxID=1747766 RepID=UPI00079B9201|nr:carbon-phosphorus lyase complex subunit PhnI [Mycobacterium sp. NAZ190054]KWX68425.1 phosphonate metabolism protein PhnI [Mycobacterium sp. NAZ190054]